MRSQTLRVLAAVAWSAALATPRMTASQRCADVEIQSLPARDPARGVRIQSTGMRGSSGRPRLTQASRPPESGRTRSMPRRRSRSATRALEASLGQVQ